MKPNYSKTLYACFVGYAVQAIVNNFVPLLNTLLLTKMPIAPLIDEEEKGLTISLAPSPVLSLLACGFCGLSVGIMWPGIFSIASAAIPKGGTALFALLALAGDFGCSAGPTVVGFAASAFHDNLHNGILCGVIFPVLLLLGLFLYRRNSIR